MGSDEEGFRGLKGWKLRAEAKLVCQRQKIIPERANVALISQLCKLDGDEDTNPGEYVTNIYAQHLKPYLCLHAATVDDFTDMVSKRRKVKLSIWGPLGLTCLQIILVSL